MDIDRSAWPRLLELLDVVLALPLAQQAKAIEGLAGDDEGLRDALRELLASQASLDDEDFMASLPRLPHDEPSGDTIGPWRLLRELGRGGMSVVHLASRDDAPTAPPVALKLPLVDALRAASIAQRFERERDILRSLEHPGIAAVRDAGIADGQPWLAIEFVDGQQIIEYGAANALPVADRLRLFLQVLDAAGHAHAQLVIHRDFKPANVLVDKAGRVKLLDFGVAKLLGDGDRAGDSALTQWGGRAMTPQYASPEQIGGAVLGTASDLYSLGVLLYELLTERLPYRLARATPGAIEEAILGGGITLPSVAAEKPAQRALRGDVDAIIAKALALRPAERYRSAEAFADDIRRHLDSRPVLARHAGFTYRAAKALRRHAWRYAAASALVLVLGIGVGTTLWQARVAHAEAVRANAVQRFVLDIFRHNSARQSDPQRARETTARELLEIGALKLEEALADSPQARVEISRVLAQMHSDLGLAERAAALRRRAVDAAEQVYGVNSPELVAALAEWAVDLHHVGRLDERRQALTRALAIVRAGSDKPSPQRAEVYRRWSELEQSGRPAEATRFADLAVADAERLDDDRERYQSYEVAAIAYHNALQDEQAEPMYAGAIAAAERCRCVFPSELVRTRVQMAEVQSQLLQPAAAERSLRQALADSLRLNGDRHLDTVQTTLRLAGTLSLHGHPRAALPLIEPLSGLVDGPGGTDSFSAPLVLNVLGNTLTPLGRFDAAAQALRRAIELRDRTRPNTPFAAALRESLARSLIGAGNWAGAAAELDAAERILLATGVKPGEARWQRLAAIFVTLHLARGELDAAERRAAEMSPGLEGSGRPTTVNALDFELLRVQIALDADRAADARRRLSQIRAVLAQRGLAAELPLVEARRRLLCGRWALAQAPAQARPHFEASLEALTAQLGAQAPAVHEAAQWRARASSDRAAADPSGPC